MAQLKPDEWRDEVIQFVRSFASITVTPGTEVEPDQIRLRRGIGDVMHVLGYYFEQNGQRLHSLSLAQRLTIASDTIRYIAGHLEDD